MRESRRLQAIQSPIIPVVADWIRACPGTVSLGQGVVSYPPPPAALEAIRTFGSDPAHHKYQAVGGIPELLNAITRLLAEEQGITIGDQSGNRLMVTAGGNMAFMNAILAITDPGDEVILPTPYYFNQEMAVTMANCRPVLVPTDENYQLDVPALRAAISPRTRAIVTVSPNNPAGTVYPHHVLREVNALCAAHGLYHLCDEAYCDFSYGAEAPRSPAADPAAAPHTLAFYSMSKSFGFASWRIGWMVYPAHLEAAMRKIQDTLIICPPVISQHAALGALTAGTAYVREKLVGLRKVRERVQPCLDELVAEGLAEVPAAEGAFYFLPRLKGPLATRSPLEIAERLIREHRVAVIPGDAFGLTAGCHLRVAYGALTLDSAAEGMGRLVHGLRRLASAD